jgi:hypothetical protein
VGETLVNTKKAGKWIRFESSKIIYIYVYIYIYLSLSLSIAISESLAKGYRRATGPMPRTNVSVSQHFSHLQPLKYGTIHTLCSIPISLVMGCSSFGLADWPIAADT